MREAFEQAIIENPDDLATYSAYADWLQEHDDPRGEFIAVQLALEDESRSKADRKKLKKREAELLADHEADWLGGLAIHLLPSEEQETLPDWIPQTEYHWRRGFLAELKVGCLTVKFAQTLADALAARFLQKLHVVGGAYDLGQDDTTPRRRPVLSNTHGSEWLELLGAPFLPSLRIFQMGDSDGEPPEDGWNDNHTYAAGIERVIAEMTRIAELHLVCKSYNRRSLFALSNLTSLRVLRMYALGNPTAWDDVGYDIQLDVLAENPALGNLTHLLLHPHFAHDQSFIPLGRVVPVFRSKHLKKLTHLQLRLSDMGDEGIREIIASGILKRLVWLDLRHGCITDEGARLLAACPDAQRLERIDLSRNAVTATGLKALREAKVNAVANNPLTEAELNEREYLHEGDFE